MRQGLQILIAFAAIGTRLAVTIRGQAIAARVVSTPFVGKA